MADSFLPNPQNTVPDFNQSASAVTPPKKNIFLAAAVILAVILIAGGAWAYFVYWRSPTPEEVIKKMFNNFTEVKSLRYDGTITLEAKNAPILPFLSGSTANTGKSLGVLGVSTSTGLAVEPEIKRTQDVNVNITLAGSADFFDSSNPKSETVYKFEASVPPQNFILGLNTKIIDEVSYLSFSDLPKIGPFDLGFLKNQWIKFDRQSFLKTLGAVGGGLDNKLAEYEKNKEDTKQKAEKIKTLIKEISLVVVSSVLPEEKMGQDRVFHYKVKIDKGGFMRLAEAAEQLLRNRDLTDKERQKINESFEAASDQQADLWIDKKDYLPRRLAFEGYSSQEPKVKFNVNFQFDNFNEALKIEAPAQSFPLDEMLTSLFGGLSGASSKKSTTTLDILDNPAPLSSAQLDTDGDGLTDREEKTVWFTNHLLPDTDHDGFSDGTEVKNGYNPKGDGKLM